MTIKKAIKVMKAVKRLKKYCSECKYCKDCMFYDANSGYSEVCMLRRKNPEEYDLDEISRGLTDE